MLVFVAMWQPARHQPQVAPPPPAKRPRTDGHAHDALTQKDQSELQAHGSNFLKLLVDNVVAGMLIGKGGSMKKEIESTTGALTRISGNNLFYPGTQMRVVAIAGSPEQLNACIETIVGVVSQAEERKKEGAEVEHISIKAALPSSSCSFVIGKGGENVKAINESCGIKVSITPHGENALGSERLATVAGHPQNVNSALQQVAQIIQQDPNLAERLYTPTTGDSGGAPVMQAAQQAQWAPQQVVTPPPPVWGQKRPPLAAPAPAPVAYGQTEERYCTIYFEVSEQEASQVIGKGGAVMKSIQQQTGTKVRLSAKGEYVPGTQNRTVTLQGPMSGVHAAHAMIMEKADQASAMQH